MAIKLILNNFKSFFRILNSGISKTYKNCSDIKLTFYLVLQGQIYSLTVFSLLMILFLKKISRKILIIQKKV